MRLTSTAFTHGEEIPVRYTCQGEEVSPPLAWSDVPAQARSLVLVVDDPDAPDPAAPQRTFAHWLLYALPPADGSLPEGVADGALPAGTRQGRNDSGDHGWTGPCPPIGRHRYFFRLHALDTALGDLGSPNRKKLLEAIEGHVIATAELMGTYEKQ